MKKYLLLFFLGSACGSMQVRPSSQQDMLFPEGRYQQEVTVQIQASHPPQDFDFEAFVQKTPEELLFVGTNSFGISLFKIREHSGQAIEAESSLPQIREHQDFFLKIFKLVKVIVNLSRNDSGLKQHGMHLEVDGLSADVHFQDFDALGIPLQMQLESPGQYSVKIHTENYQLRKGIGPH